MANNLGVTTGSDATIKTTDNAGIHTPHHNVDTVTAVTTITNPVKINDGTDTLLIDTHGSAQVTIYDNAGIAVTFNGNGQSTMSGSAPVTFASDQTGIKNLYKNVSSGYGVAPFTLISSAEINALTNGSTAVSAASGTSGKFSQTDFANCIYGYVWLTVVTAGWTPTPGGNFTGWFLASTDGGTTFERTHANNAIPRAPDFIIPFEAAALSAGDVVYSGLCRLPAYNCKVFVQNNTGATTGAGNHTITCGPIVTVG